MKFLNRTVALLMMVSFFWMFKANVQAAPEDTVNIPDAELRRYLCEEHLGKEEGYVITEGDLAGITYVKIYGNDYDVKDLTGLEYCTNMTSIYLWGCDDVTAVPDCSNMPNLKSVSVIGSDNFSDISGLYNCWNLTHVELNPAWGLRDISSLEGKSGITYLDLYGAAITEETEQEYMKTIASLVNMEEAYFNFCELSTEHMSMLEPLNKLKKLDLTFCEVDNLDFLVAHKEDLCVLSLYENPVTNSSVDVLKQLTNLEILDVGCTGITDFSFIPYVPKLTNKSMSHVNWEPTEIRPIYYVYDCLPSGDSFVIKNEVKDEKGNTIVPEVSPLFSYNATTEEITIPLSCLDDWGCLQERIKYAFTVTTVSGQPLEIEVYADAYVLMITEQPQNAEVYMGEDAALYVYSIGGRKSYQWYKDGVAIPDATSYMLQLNDLAKEDEGSYHVVVSSYFHKKTITSKQAKVTVKSPITITGQPVSQKVAEGTDAIFRVEANGSNLTYRWQFKNTVSDWVDSTMVGANTNSIAVKGTAARDGYQYRCILKDAKGNELISEPAKLTVIKAINITTQPVSRSVTEGTNVTFKVEAQGTNLTYQWQFKNATNNYWSNSTMAGATTNSMTVKATAARDGYQYRCVIKDSKGNKVTSNAVKLTIAKPIEITTQPVSTRVTEGRSATFKVVANGTNLTYQWQFKNATNNYWSNSTMAGATTNSITIKATAARDGYQYRCVIKDSKGNKVTSNAASLTIGKPIEITTQPANQSVAVGTNATFKVVAIGSDLTYQWQFKSPANAYWADSTMTGATTNSITVKGTTARNGYQYRCVIKDSNGNKVTSDGAKLTVK